ncbi:MAG TPA: thioredoxin [Firmicutes bacterium]|nr:thioredoxin [Bacillota bacterium]
MIEKLIDEATEKQLKQKFDMELKDEVQVMLFVNEIITGSDQGQQPELNMYTEKFVNELAGITDKIKVVKKGTASEEAKELGITTSPSLSIGRDKGYNIKYNGAPLGNEATGVIETIGYVSRGDSGFPDEIRAMMKKINQKAEIKTFVTPECPYCPKAVMQANRIAVESKGMVSAECVESAENRDLAVKFNVSSVPAVFINDDAESAAMGVQKDKDAVLRVLKYAAPGEYEKIKEEADKMEAEKEKLPENPEGTVTLTDNNFKDALEKYENLVVDCWADWCMPCKMIAPIIDELAGEQKGKVVYGKLNVDENPNKAAEYKIMSIPTLMFFKKGEKKGDLAGLQPKAQLLEQGKYFFGI